MDNMLDNLSDLTEKNLSSIADHLKDEKNRLDLNYQHLNKILQLTQSLPNQNIDYDLVVINLFKITRNACIACSKNNTLIINSHLFYFLGSEFIKAFDFLQNNESSSSSFSTNKLNIIINGLQCFGNMISGTLESNHIRLKVNKTVSFNILIQLLMYKKHKSIPKLSTFVIYNLILDNQILETIEQKEWIDLSQVILENIVSDYSPSEWSLLCIHHFLKNELYLTFVYPSLEPRSKLILCDIILEKIKENDKISCPINEQNLKILLDTMLKGLKKISKNEEMSDELSESLILNKLFSIFGEITIQFNKWISNQDEKELTSQIVDMLKTHHLLSKNTSSPNSYNLADTNDSLFELKKNLVRLLANLCYHNGRVQDIAREKDAIPLLLDMFGIDQKNPFLREWCILAIRNLLENNLANQEIVVSLTKQDVIADEKLLKKFGLKITTDHDLKFKKLLKLRFDNKMK